MTTSYVGKIFTATYTSDYVNLLACWSRYFPESVLDGYIGVGYSLFYYLLLVDLLENINCMLHLLYQMLVVEIRVGRYQVFPIPV